MLSIATHYKKSPSLHYVLEIVFNEFLGVDFQLSDEKTESLAIWVEGSSSCINLNAFLFDCFDRKELVDEISPIISLRFLDAMMNGLLDHRDSESCLVGLPVLFGNASLVIESETIRIDFDLFGTIFFMLSRFEEVVSSATDKHDRFPACASVAYKYGFLHRPIVDEYVELLWACIRKLWPDLKRREKKPRTIVSCDVDTPFDPTVRTFSRLLKTCVSDLVKRKSVVTAVMRIERYIHNKRGDYPFDANYSVGLAMDVCEQFGLKAVFYFIPTSIERNNGDYELSDSAIRNLLLKIDARGHEIGVHGSYQTYLDGAKMVEQKQLLENTLAKIGIRQKIRGNRQHYLRWSSFVTPDLLEVAGFEYDATGGYADSAGFRFGTSKEFSMWSWARRRKLVIKQRPLIVMECSVIDQSYAGLGASDEAAEFIAALKRAALKDGGIFSILWHNSNLSQNERKVFLKSLQS